MSVITSVRRASVATIALCALASCSGGEGGGTPSPTETGTPGFTLAAGSGDLTLAQGGTATVPVTVTRTGGFGGAVSVSVEGLPAGVTADPLTIITSASSGDLRLVATQEATVGAASLTLRGRADGIGDQTAARSLTVQSTPALVLSVSTAAVAMRQAERASLAVKVRRTGGFTGPVELSVEGLSPGVTATSATIAAADSTATLALSALHTAATGNASLRVRARATGVTDQAATVSLAVTLVNFHQPAAEELIVCTNKETAGKFDQYDCRLRTMGDYGLPALGTYVVRRPGVALFDRAARRAELAAVSSQVALIDACRWMGQRSWAIPASLPREYNRDTPGLQQRVLDVNNLLLDAGSRWLGLRDAVAADWIRQTLLVLAQSEALVGFERRNVSAYDAKRLAMVGFNAFYTIDDFSGLSAADRGVIVDYLGKLMGAVNYLEAAAWNEPVNVLHAGDIHNHSWFKDSEVMQWGAYRGDHRAFQAGVRRYVTVLAGLVREDGSIAAEASRGGVAIHYTANAIAHMIQFAETAALQGYDLYGIQIGGADIHKLVKFYLDARDNHAVITKYAQAQWNCLSPEQCAAWNNQDLSSVNQNWWNVASWAEVYIRRFPNTTLSNRLRALYPTTTFRHMVSDVWGGSTTCQVRRL